MITEITKFEDIQAWQEARNLTREVYAISGMGDFNKDLELKSRMRRSVVSIMFSIASGFVLQTNREFRNYLIESLGAAASVQVALYIALDQNYINQTQFDKIYSMTEHVGNLILDLLKFDSGQ